VESTKISPVQRFDMALLWLTKRTILMFREECFFNMDWMKQSQEMFNSWANVQMKTWESWLKAIQNSEKLEPQQLWEKTIDAWQESVKGTLEAQVEGSRIWAESFTNIEGTPEGTADWAKQIQGMTKNWTDMQQQVWDNWFDVVKKADPSKFGVNWDTEGPNMLKTWQDMAQKSMETQTEWAKSITSMAQPKK